MRPQPEKERREVEHGVPGLDRVGEQTFGFGRHRQSRSQLAGEAEDEPEILRSAIGTPRFPSPETATFILVK
jgi:hypothetical protein